MSETEDAPRVGFTLPLLFVFMTVPFLLEYCERRQDCYVTQDDCAKDWSTSDCKPNANPHPTCPYVGRSYRGFMYGRSFGSYGGHSVGTVSRGGFGGFGHAFGGGS